MHDNKRETQIRDFISRFSVSPFLPMLYCIPLLFCVCSIILLCISPDFGVRSFIFETPCLSSVFAICLSYFS